MSIPRPPYWLAIGAALALLVSVALGRRERADAPPPPPPLASSEGAALAQASPIDPILLVKVRSRGGLDAASAVSVGDSGVWLTLRAALADCPRPAVLVNDTEGVAVKIAPGPGQIAVLTTPAGAPALPLASTPLAPGELGFAPGFPRGRPGEVALRLLGRETPSATRRVAAPVPVLAWAEIGRTEGLEGSLAGLSGAPALDSEGRIVGLVLGEEPRRGRLYTTTPETLAAALAVAKAARPAQAAGAVLTADNYGLAGDDLRRTLRIAALACLAH